MDFVTMYKSVFFDLPLTSFKSSLGMATEKEATETAWNGYDAGVRMATAAIDTLYRSPLFGTVFSSALSTALRWQQLNHAVSGAVYTSLWKSLGVPTAADIHGLSKQVRALEAHLSHMAQIKESQAIPDHARTRTARPQRVVPAAATLQANNYHDEPTAA